VKAVVWATAARLVKRSKAAQSDILVMNFMMIWELLGIFYREILWNGRDQG